LPLLAAVAIACFARILFVVGEARPSAGFVYPLYPFVIGGFAFLAARRAYRTWSAVRDTAPVSGARDLRMTMAFIGFLIDVLLIIWAVVFLLLMTVGIGIS
jgi:hypothetical protein